MTGYELSRSWFDFCFENPERIRPIHTAIYFFAIEHNNRLGWKAKFGLPSLMTMEACGIKNGRTYRKALDELEQFGFIKFIQRSKNQYSSNIIALSKNTQALDKALDKALIKHSTKQGQSIAPVDKPIKPIKQKNNITMEARKLAFQIQIGEYSNKYSGEFLNSFYKTWTEYKKSPNETEAQKNKKQMRFEKQDTWETGKRLGKYIDYENQNKSKIYQAQSNEPSQASRIPLAPTIK